jgi:hypothetical protein
MRSKIRHRVIILGDSRRNREDLVRILDSKEEKSSKKKMKINPWL